MSNVLMEGQALIYHITLFQTYSRVFMSNVLVGGGSSFNISYYSIPDLQSSVYEQCVGGGSSFNISYFSIPDLQSSVYEQCVGGGSSFDISYFSIPDLQSSVYEQCVGWWRVKL